SNITYEGSSNNGSTWTDKGTSRSHSLGNASAGTHTLVVRAKNTSGPGGTSAPAPVTLTPAITLKLVKGAAAPSPTRTSGCRRVAAETTGMPNGNYTMNVYASSSPSGNWGSPIRSYPGRALTNGYILGDYDSSPTPSASFTYVMVEIVNYGSG